MNPEFLQFGEETAICPIQHSAMLTNLAKKFFVLSVLHNFIVSWTCIFNHLSSSLSLSPRTFFSIFLSGESCGRTICMFIFARLPTTCKIASFLLCQSRSYLITTAFLMSFVLVLMGLARTYSLGKQPRTESVFSWFDFCDLCHYFDDDPNLKSQPSLSLIILEENF